jgi:hypothetical protein
MSDIDYVEFKMSEMLQGTVILHEFINKKHKKNVGRTQIQENKEEKKTQDTLEMRHLGITETFFK